MKNKILVIDDEPDALELIEFNFKQSGYEVATAAHGEEGFNKARALLPDLIVLDVWGYETMIDTRTVDTHMRRLREKLGGEAAQCLETVRGVGYRFAE